MPPVDCGILWHLFLKKSDSGCIGNFVATIVGDPMHQFDANMTIHQGATMLSNHCLDSKVMVV